MKSTTANSENPAGEERLVPAGQNEEHPEDQSARVLSVLRLIWQKRRLLSRLTAWGMAFSLAVAILLPGRYESTARLMPPDSQSGSGLAFLAALSGQGGGLGALAADALGGKSSSGLFVGILASTTVQDRLIHDFQLRDVYGEKRIEDARRALTEHTDITEDRRSGIISITVSDKVPQRATALAGRYIRELDRLVAEVATSAARREREFLEERLKVVKQEWDTAAGALSQFASANAAIDIKEQARAMVESAAMMQGQLVAAQTELESLKQIYTENNVRVRAARARVMEIERQLQKIAGIPAGTDSHADGEKSSGYPSIRMLPVLGVRYAELYRKVKVAEVVYELLTQQYELAKVQEAKEIPTVRVLDSPSIPEKRSGPARLWIFFGGSSLCFVAGIFWVLGSARWQQIDAQDPGKEFVREVFASVGQAAPWNSTNGNLLTRMTKRWMPKRSTKAGGAAHGDGLSNDPGPERTQQKDPAETQ